MFWKVAGYLRHAGWKDWDVLQFRTAFSMVWSIYPVHGKRPALVAKYCYGSTMQNGARECAALERLAPFADGLGIPRLLFQSADEDGCVYIQSAAPGRPLRAELSPSSREIDAHFDLIEPWLQAFQAAIPPAADSPGVYRQVLDAAPAQTPAALLAVARERLPILWNAPAVVVHGDFWSQNILLDGGRVSVVDWETLHYGSPLEDLLTYSVALVRDFRADAERGGDEIWEVFFGSSRLAQRIREAAGRTLARLQLTDEALQPLFLLALTGRLACVQFMDNPAWHAFARRYAAAGCPPLWSSAAPRRAAAHALAQSAAGGATRP